MSADVATITLTGEVIKVAVLVHAGIYQFNMRSVCRTAYGDRAAVFRVSVRGAEATRVQDKRIANEGDRVSVSGRFVPHETDKPYTYDLDVEAWQVLALADSRPVGK